MLRKNETLRNKKESLTSFLKSRIIRPSNNLKKEKGECPIIVSKEKLVFNDKQCDIGDVVFDYFEIRSVDGNKVKFKFEYNDFNQPYLIKFDPPSGSVSKNKVAQIHVSATIKILNTKEIKVNIVSGLN